MTSNCTEYRGVVVGEVPNVCAWSRMPMPSVDGLGLENITSSHIVGGDGQDVESTESNESSAESLQVAHQGPGR